MKILYVSGIWAGIRPLLFEGQEKESGMPAFVFPLKEIVARGHEVTLLFLAKRAQPELRIGPEWLRRCRLEIAVTNQSRSFLRKKAVGTRVREELTAEDYDFLYLQGEKGSHLWKLGEEFGLPVGQRVYGVDNAARSLPGTPRLWARIKKPQLHASFTGRKAFVIVTRDGSRGDRLQEHLAPRPAYRFFHRLNGVERPPEPPATDESTLPRLLADRPYLFCPARFATMKAKERTLQFLARMHALGHRELRLVVAGQHSKAEEYTLFQKEKERLELSEQVVELGTLSREEVTARACGSLAVLSFYRFSNLSNVSLEALSLGALLVTLDDGSLEGVCGPEEALIAPSVEEAAEAFHRLLSAPDAASRYRDLRQGAARKALATLQTWQERAAWEADLIEESAVPRPERD
ncbi:glycosyltransferase [Roseibacillus ishigakijimensis]|uniref:Glycosyltransferase family 4 protein n=1 Tax=Roseibacillus ishigakijimensis TaxID=454146 RepID=A0A934VLW9_9BACT|nr:glycosyltransferase [Roseibacillus ishigakijimensis]MBK1833672.1 glycosyltransferase family 4 protein [Roseibacillus ishigakijimensis]